VTKKDQALALHSRGFNCSQSVAAVYADDLGLKSTDALRMAAAFGGGIGRSGQTCGAVTGALMVLGMKYGMTEADAQAKERMYVIAQDFLRQFAQRHGTLLCRDLVNADISTPEGRAVMRERNIHATVCAPLIAEATALLDEMLK
jgi:C_GCAxxG_C_C family probable redox protein